MSNQVKTLMGTVVSTKTEKTIVVKIAYQTTHKRFKKVVQKSKKVMAHDEDSKAKDGDRVIVRESRPLSKMKRYVLESVVETTV